MTNNQKNLSAERKDHLKRIYARAETEVLSPFQAPVKAVSEDEIKKIFNPPKTLGLQGVTEDVKRAHDSAFSSGFNTYYESLTQHAENLGQFPMTSFVGYGVLQQIAQNGMIRTCVQTVADDMTREWITITGGDDTNPENLQKITETLEKKFGLRKLFNKVFSTVGFMGGCFIYIKTEADEADLKLPLAINSKSAEITQSGDIELVLIEPVNVSPGMYNASDPLRTDYMKPTEWFVMGKEIHATRLIRCMENEPPLLLKPAYNFLGIPQAQILWDYVLHWNKARAEGVGLLEKLNFMVYKTNLSEAIEAGGVSMVDQKVNLVNRYRSNNSLVVCNTDESFENITLTISGVTDIIKQQFEFIAAMNRTPAVKLLGISPSGFNATGQSDIRNYYDHIRAKQERYREAIQTIIDIVQINLFGEIDPSISFEFSELSQEDETATAMTAKTQLDGASVLLDRNVISAEEVREFVKRNPSMGFDFLGDEMPEPVDGDLQTDDPSAQNMDLMKMLSERNNNQPEQQEKKLVDIDKAGEVY